MKKILFMIAMAVSSIANSQNATVQPQGNVSTDKGMLDGKAYVVMVSENSSGTTVVKTGDADTRQDPGNKENTQDRTMPSGKPNTMKIEKNTGKKMLIHFDHGMVKTSGSGDTKVEKCVYNSWGMESTGISFSADCNSGTTQNNKPSSSMNETPPATGGQNNSNASSGTSASATTTQPVNAEEATSSVKPNTPETGKSGIQLTGTVNGNTIHGSITCMKADGTVKTYSFTGSTAGKNDLDMENETGMK